MSEPIEAVLIGAGERGANSYAPYAIDHPEEIRFVAVAEPDAGRRKRFAARHHLPEECCFSSWQEMLQGPRLGTAALVCTQDWQHTAPAEAALKSGYDVLLEKPMATQAAECIRLVEDSELTGHQLYICHVLRYTNHFQKMREIVQSGTLGDVIDVAHRENISYAHMAHSYVRGNWRSRDQSSPMILAKCCHDFDILLWVLGRRCKALSSFGQLTHFRPENAPQGAPEYCMDGCPAAQTCLYNAEFVYLKQTPLWRSYADTSTGFEHAMVATYLQRPRLVRAASRVYPALRELTEYRGWPNTVVTPDPTPENLRTALRKSPYGRCVYRCDNDVVDHQVVAMQFEGGATVTLTMQGHSHTEYRTTRIEGTRGRLQAQFGAGGSWIDVDEHLSDTHTRYDTSDRSGSGHGGGDSRLVAAFVQSLRGDAAAARTTARMALESHLMAFGAERARLENRVICADEFLKG
jgi:predicted dehydrogenase